MDAGINPESRTLEITRTFKAPRALVFKVWTQPEHIARWWGCGAMVENKVTNDLRVGGGFRSDMTLEDGTHQVILGKYIEIDEPARLSFTWNWESGLLGTETVVTITLMDQGAETVMTMRHEIFDTADLCNAHNDGWTASLDRLADLLASGALA